MNDNRDYLLGLLNYINPASLSYQDWVNVGAAMKHEGLTADDFDSWSKADSRYKEGECFRKWESFKRTDGDIVTGGTLYEMARAGGYVLPSEGTGEALDWDSSISFEGTGRIVDPAWVESDEFREPADDAWHPVQELITYLRTLFQSTENVGYVTDVYQNE
jgi:hypothetical protein